jgi:type IV pilus assembly protein PilB
MRFAAPLGILPREEVAGYELVDLYARNLTSEVLEQLPAWVVRRYRIMPIALDATCLVVALEDPEDLDLLEKIRFITDRDLRVVFASRAALDCAIDTWYPAPDDVEA